MEAPKLKKTFTLWGRRDEGWKVLKHLILNRLGGIGEKQLALTSVLDPSICKFNSDRQYIQKSSTFKRHKWP